MGPDAQGPNLEEQAENLALAASSATWQERYEALQSALNLPVALRRRVAERFLSDSNSWVHELATRIAQPSRSSFGHRFPSVGNLDAIARASQLTLDQRIALIQLLEDASQSGGLDYLALAADRASRLVTNALSDGEVAARATLVALQRFLRHVGYYARPSMQGRALTSVASAVETPVQP